MRQDEPPRRPSNFKRLAVICGFVRDGIKVREHVRPHVGQDQALGPNLAQVSLETGQVEVIFHLPVEEVGLANEKVRSPPCLNKRVRPLGVARVADDAVVRLNSQREGWRTACVIHNVGRNRQAGQVMAPSGLKLDDPELELLGCLRRAGEEDLHCCSQTLAHPRWSSNRERDGSLREELRIQDEEGQTAEVVTMEVAHENRLDAVGHDARPLHRDERRGPAVDDEASRDSLDQDAGIEPPTTSKRIPAPEKRQLHRGTYDFGDLLSTLLRSFNRAPAYANANLA